MKALFKKWEIQRAEAMKRHSTNNWKILGLPNNSSQPHTNSLSSKAPGFWKQGSVILRGCVQGTFLVSWSFQRTYTPSPRVPTQMANSNCKWWTTCLTCWNIASVSLCSLCAYLNSCHACVLVHPTLCSFLIHVWALRTPGKLCSCITPYNVQLALHFLADIHPLCSVPFHRHQELNKACDPSPPAQREITALAPSSPALSAALCAVLCMPFVRSPCCFCMVVKSSKVRVRTGGLQKA